MEHPARKIKFLMRTGSFTVPALSEKLGITTECLREILDEQEMPTPHLLYGICNIFGVKEDYFEEALRPRRPDRPRPPAAGEEAEEKEIQVPVPAEVKASRPGAPAAKSSPPRERPAAASAKALRPRTGRRKLDLAEIVARQHALVDLLIAKNVFSRDEYETRLEILRAKVIARKGQR
jgi:hypothetical protein